MLCIIKSLYILYNLLEWATLYTGSLHALLHNADVNMLRLYSTSKMYIIERVIHTEYYTQS